MNSEENTIIGEWIDMPLNKFKEKLIEEKTPVGVISNMILLLESQFWDLYRRKQYFVDKVTRKDSPDYGSTEYEELIQSIYAEMVKIEGKVVYLKKRRNELMTKANKKG